MSSRSKITFHRAAQLEMMPDQILIEDVPDEHRPLDVPAEEELIVMAGSGSAKNPKHNKQSPGIYLVRKVGSDVTNVKAGDWILLSWRAVMPESEACLNEFYIKGGNFAVMTEGGVAAKIRPLGATG